MKDLLTEARVMLGEDREHILEESFKIAVEKFGEDSKPTIDLFRKLVNKNQFQGQEKDINYWIKQGFEKFKSKVMEVEQKGSKTSQKKERNSTPHKEAIKIKDTENYEVFQIPSYEASKFMGRFYRNKSAGWCISTDSELHFNQSYRDSSFYFFIRKEFLGDTFDKIALELKVNEKIVYWSSNDNMYSGESSEIPQEIKDYKVVKFPRFDPILREVIRGTYEIVDGRYNVKGHVQFDDITVGFEDDELPVPFGIIDGDFYCGDHLETFKNAPIEVKGEFDYGNSVILKDCDGCPKKVGGNFWTTNLDDEDIEYIRDNCEIGGDLITD